MYCSIKKGNLTVKSIEMVTTAGNEWQVRFVVLGEIVKVSSTPLSHCSCLPLPFAYNLLRNDKEFAIMNLLSQPQPLSEIKSFTISIKKRKTKLKS